MGGGSRRGVHVGKVLIEKGASRRWFMLVDCFIEREFNNFLLVLIMIDLYNLIEGDVNKQRGEIQFYESNRRGAVYKRH